jgi:predicted nuclease of restriction endonuclease-like RecB superfamily
MFRRSGVIKPVFIREQLGILDTLIAVYKEHVGKKRGVLNEAVSDCEYLGYDFRMVRGLASVLEARSVFQYRSSIAPLEARRQVFSAAADAVVASKDERLEVLGLVAERNGLSVEELDDSLYADLDDEQYLVDFRKIDSQTLMKQYNYANMLALLAYSLRLEFYYRGSDDYIEHQMERLGKATITVENRIKAVIELKSTRRLSQRASRIDEILRRVIEKPGWSLRANIKYPQRYKTVCVFEINNKDGGDLIAVDHEETETVIEIGLPKKKERKYADIVVLDDEARLRGVITAQIKKEIEEEGTKYRDLGGVLVTPELHKELRRGLKELETLDEAQVYLKDRGVRDIVAVLEAYGYQIEWDKPRGNSKIYRL